jgi:Tfp pilus assembly PilM family ATPase
VPGLLEALRQEFSLPVEVLNPFQKIGFGETTPNAEMIGKNAGQLAVAVGLALRSFETL